MNVNIRVTLDVTHGSINVYLSPKEDTFVIKQDENNWIHRVCFKINKKLNQSLKYHLNVQVEFDTKYSLAGDARQHSSFGKVSLFAGETIKVDPDYEFTTNRSDDILEESGVNRVISKPMGMPTSAYRFVEQEAAGFSTYYTVKDSKAILLVRNLRNRLVITLPQVRRLYLLI
jgi:hypothetical protein